MEPRELIKIIEFLIQKQNETIEFQRQFIKENITHGGLDNSIINNNYFLEISDLSKIVLNENKRRGNTTINHHGNRF